MYNIFLISYPDSSRVEKNSKGGIWQNSISSCDQNQCMLVVQLVHMFSIVFVFLEICLCSFPFFIQYLDVKMNFLNAVSYSLAKRGDTSLKLKEKQV